MTEAHCKSVTFPHDTLRSLLSDAIIELCRREAFYVEELRIEGTICVVSDRSSALIVQITEQVGNKTSSSDGTSIAGGRQLPVVVTTQIDCDGTAEAPPTVHTNEGQGRSSSTAVKQYIRRRLRSCRHCGAQFIRLGSLQSHVRRRHPLAVLSSRRKGLVSYLPSNKVHNPVDSSQEGTSINVSRNSELSSNPNMLLSTLKSEPGCSADSLHGFPPDLNLSLQQMVRTLSMMSSLPINNNGHFPAGFTMASSGAGSYPAEDEPIELRRSADGKFMCPYCTKTYGFKHSLKEHIDVHRGRRPHICRHCGASFAHLASLCAHIRRRHDDRMPAQFQCSLCGEKLMNLQSLKQHRTWRHKDAPRLSDPLPPLSAPSAGLTSTRSNVSADPLPGGKKEGRSTTAVDFTPVQRSTTANSGSSVMYSNTSSSCTTDDIQFKLPSVNARGPTQRKDSTAAPNLQPFDGFEFQNFLPSVNDFQSSTWAGGHVTNPGVDTGVNCQNQSLAVSASKFFPETPAELPAAGHSQSKTPASMQYRSPDGIPDGYFVTAVCPGCSAKFRTEAEYRRHVACHPDHVTLSWRQ